MFGAMYVSHVLQTALDAVVFGVMFLALLFFISGLVRSLEGLVSGKKYKSASGLTFTPKTFVVRPKK